jgi:hypothetical protein
MTVKQFYTVCAAGALLGASAALAAAETKPGAAGYAPPIVSGMGHPDATPRISRRDN